VPGSKALVFHLHSKVVLPYTHLFMVKNYYSSINIVSNHLGIKTYFSNILAIFTQVRLS